MTLEKQPFGDVSPIQNSGYDLLTLRVSLRVYFNRWITLKFYVSWNWLWLRQPTPPNVPTPRNSRGPLWSGLMNFMNHWVSLKKAGGFSTPRLRASGVRVRAGLVDFFHTTEVNNKSRRYYWQLLERQIKAQGLSGVFWLVDDTQW